MMTHCNCSKFIQSTFEKQSGKMENIAMDFGPNTTRISTLTFYINWFGPNMYKNQQVDILYQLIWSQYVQESARWYSIPIDLAPILQESAHVDILYQLIAVSKVTWGRIVSLKIKYKSSHGNIRWGIEKDAIDRLFDRS